MGEGTYRFSVAPYYLVYKLVGYDPIWAYYLLSLLFYFLTSLTVYHLYSKLIDSTSGRIAGLLFAAGYIASDGFMWLTTSITQSLSIIFVLLTLCRIDL